MKHVIPTVNWHMALADAIDASQDGDVIVVQNEAQKELGEIAKSRVCPDKNITFEVKET